MEASLEAWISLGAARTTGLSESRQRVFSLWEKTSHASGPGIVSDPWESTGPESLFCKPRGQDLQSGWWERSRSSENPWVARHFFASHDTRNHRVNGCRSDGPGMLRLTPVACSR